MGLWTRVKSFVKQAFSSPTTTSIRRSTETSQAIASAGESLASTGYQASTTSTRTSSGGGGTPTPTSISSGTRSGGGGTPTPSISTVSMISSEGIKQSLAQDLISGGSLSIQDLSPMQKFLASKDIQRKIQVQASLRAKEIYDPRTGMFISPSLTGGTGFQRKPTLKEQKKIDRAKALGSLSPLPKDIIPLGISEKVVREGVKLVVPVIDFVSVGGVTSSQLNKKQEKINSAIGKFNKKYGDKELTEAQYNQAQKEILSLEDKQKALVEEQRTFEISKFFKVSDLVFGTGALGDLRPTEAEEKRVEENLRDLKTQVKSAKGLNKKRLEGLIKGQEENLARIKRGEKQKVSATAVPLVPATSLLSRLKTLKFAGIQKTTKAGDIVTDLVFVTEKGKRVGVASGLSRRGVDDFIDTIVLGRSGRVGVKFPSGKPTAKQIQSFAGRGISKQTQIGLKLKSTFETDKTVLNLVSTEEIALTKSLGIGQSISARGRKLIKTGVEFPSGKIVQKPVKVFRDTFMTKSLARQEDDLIKIAGGTKTFKGQKIAFKGIIKKAPIKKAKEGVESVRGRRGRPTPFTKTEEKALTDTVSSVASSLKTKTDIAKPLATITSSTPVTVRAILKTKTTTKVKTKPSQIIKDLEKQVSATSQIPSLAERTKTKTVARTKTRQTAKQQQALDTLQVSLTSQATAQAQKVAQATKQTTKQVQALSHPVTIFPSIVSPRVFPFFFWRKKKKVGLGVEAKAPSYDVYIKEAKKKRFTKVTKKPVKLQDARNLRNTLIDQSISRQGYLKPRQIKPSALPYAVSPTYARDTAKKFRQFKQKKGKKTKLQPERVIEKSKFALDHPSEIKQLSVFKKLAQLERKKQAKLKEPVGLSFA